MTTPCTPCHARLWCARPRSGATLCMSSPWRSMLCANIRSKKNAEVGMLLRCFRKCLFGILQNTEFYTELTLFRVIPRNILVFSTAKFREIRIPLNENSSIQPITINLWKLVLYFVVNTVDKQLKKKTKEKYKRNGICRGIPRNSI